MGNTEVKNITLENLGGGAAVEMFGNCLQQVLININDPNTEYKKSRIVTLEVELKPLTEDRDMCDYSIKCKAKLAPSRPFSKKLYVGQDTDGSYIAREKDPNQAELFSTEKFQNINQPVN